MKKAMRLMRKILFRFAEEREKSTKKKVIPQKFESCLEDVLNQETFVNIFSGEAVDEFTRPDLKESEHWFYFPLCFTYVLKNAILYIMPSSYYEDYHVLDEGKPDYLKGQTHEGFKLFLVDGSEVFVDAANLKAEDLMNRLDVCCSKKVENSKGGIRKKYRELAYEAYQRYIRRYPINSMIESSNLAQVIVKAIEQDLK